jgi:hypothetical protein
LALRQSASTHNFAYSTKGQGTHFWNWICWQRYFWHEAVLPPPVSLLMAWRLFWRSQSARGEKALLMLSVVHSMWVPELSESRYSARWSGSQIRLT